MKSGLAAFVANWVTQGCSCSEHGYHFEVVSTLLSSVNFLTFSWCTVLSAVPQDSLLFARYLCQLYFHLYQHLQILSVSLTTKAARLIIARELKARCTRESSSNAAAL